MLTNIKAPKNGYAYIYVSNESDEPVYFDNLQVTQNHGRIVEENHYYAYGLKVAAISSKKLGDANEGSLKNNNLYNDKEINEDADLNWYDYGFRSYDPQIGRFPQLDPLTDDYPQLTPYQYASCDPIDNIDVDGLEGTSALFATLTASEKSYEFVASSTKTVVKALGKVALDGNTITQGLKALGSAIVESAKDVISFAASAGNAALTNNIGGVGRSHPNTIAGVAGAKTGDILSLIQSGIEIGGGALLAGGGGASLIIPGVGEIAAPIGIVIGKLGIIHGAVVGVTGLKNFLM